MNLRTEKICIFCPTKEFGQTVWDYLIKLGYRTYDQKLQWRDYKGLKTYIWVNHSALEYITSADNNKFCNDVILESGDVDKIMTFFETGKVKKENIENNKNMNIKNLKIGIKVGKSKILQNIVQDLYFKAGKTWSVNGKSYIDYSKFHGNDTYYYIDGNDIAHGGKNIKGKDYSFYDAATQMGEIVKLFEEKAAPEVHGYKLDKYVKISDNEGHITFGCATISIPMLKSIKEWFEDSGAGCNRKISSITLDSGKVLTKEQVTEIIEYWDKQPLTK